MAWNLDTSIKGGGTGNHIGRSTNTMSPAGDVGQGGGLRVWAWYGIGVPAGAKRATITFSVGARAGANAAGNYILVVQTPDSVIHTLANVRFHNHGTWWHSFNHTLMGMRNIPNAGTMNVWLDAYNDAGSGTPLYTRYGSVYVNWFD